MKLRRGKFTSDSAKAASRVFWGDSTREQRFWQKVDRSGNCWIWLAGTFRCGYGQFGIDGGRKISAHRYAYELIKGPIPKTLELDHLCRTPACVNPAHLEPVTHQENMLRIRKANASKTHCKHGHPLIEANIYVAPLGDRQCRACKVIALARSKGKK
jgi:hypothetical protein